MSKLQADCNRDQLIYLVRIRLPTAGGYETTAVIKRFSSNAEDIDNSSKLKKFYFNEICQQISPKYFVFFHSHISCCFTLLGLSQCLNYLFSSCSRSSPVISKLRPFDRGVLTSSYSFQQDKESKATNGKQVI